MAIKSPIINYIRGDSRTINLQVYQADGVTPFNLTGATVFFTVNAASAPTDDTSAVISLTTTTHTAPLLGQSSVLITNALTNSTPPGQYFYDAQVKDANGNFTSLPQGQFNVQADITRRIT
jgi:hypothetical protein